MSLRSLLTWIALSCLSSFGASSQVLVRIQEQTHYCFTEPQARELAIKATEGDICEDQLFVLGSENHELRGKVSDLEERLTFKHQIIEEKDIIQDLTEKQVDISDNERKRLERKALWKGIWQQGKEYIIGGIALMAGGAVGYGIGSTK
jgi:hypothetical protein